MRVEGETGYEVVFGKAEAATAVARELLLGFLLDMTEDYPVYDHMDLTPTPSVGLTLRCGD